MRILSLDGGGYLGLASAAFLDEVERYFGVSCHERFDLFCGTSTGAIIALALASGLTAQEVTQLYKDLGPEVFPSSRVQRLYRAKVRKWFAARHSNDGLRTVLARAFGNTTLGDLKARGKYALVAAYSVDRGAPRIFKTDHSKDLRTDDAYLVRDVALASASAPLYLPMASIRSATTGVEERFADGGLFANHPALLGYAEALYHLRVSPADVAILSVSTPRSDLAERASGMSAGAYTNLSRGVIGWMGTIGPAMIDGTSAITESALQRIVEVASDGRARYTRVVMRKPPGVDFDVVTPGATATLIQIATERACDRDVRIDLKPLFHD